MPNTLGPFLVVTLPETTQGPNCTFRIWKSVEIGLRKFRLVLADVSWEERLRYEPKECGWVSRIQLNNTWFIVDWLPPAIWGLEQCYVSLLLSNVLLWNANKLALWLIVLHS